MNDNSIVLLSGGLDSLVTLAIAVMKKKNIFALHTSYGQITQKKELEAFNNITNYYDIKNKLIVDIDYLKQIGGTKLIDKNFDNKNTNEQIPNTYVPFRNANLLAIATSWAEVVNANKIFIGASEVDFSGYPDCRKKFFDAFEKTIFEGTKFENKIKIETPLISWTKKQIVKKGIELSVPFQLSWSCYFSNDAACGECDSCKLRLKGFESTGMKDPIEYKKI